MTSFRHHISYSYNVSSTIWGIQTRSDVLVKRNENESNMILPTKETPQVVLVHALIKASPNHPASASESGRLRNTSYHHKWRDDSALHTSSTDTDLRNRHAM